MEWGADMGGLTANENPRELFAADRRRKAWVSLLITTAVRFVLNPRRGTEKLTGDFADETNTFPTIRDLCAECRFRRLCRSVAIRTASGTPRRETG